MTDPTKRPLLEAIEELIEVADDSLPWGGSDYAQTEHWGRIQDAATKVRAAMQDDDAAVQRVIAAGLHLALELTEDSPPGLGAEWFEATEYFTEPTRLAFLQGLRDRGWQCLGTSCERDRRSGRLPARLRRRLQFHMANQP